MGVLVFSPFILTAGSWINMMPRRVWLRDIIIISGAAILTSSVVFLDIVTPTYTNALIYGLIPIVIWSAFRVKQNGVALIVLIVSSFAVYGTANGYGPFVHETVNTSLFYLHTYLVAVMMLGLFLGAVIAERGTKSNELVLHKQHLESLVNERTHDLLLAQEKAEKESQQKSAFLATMSHEFRTPLNAILGFSQVIQEETHGPLGSEKYKEQLGDIYSSGQHLLSLVNDILDSSAIEAGKRNFNLEETDIGLTLRSCASEIEPIAAENGIRLSVKTPDDLPLIQTDERSIVQIALNLLSNAIKFTDVNGTVSIGATVANDTLVIQVEDTGIGIPAEKLPTITDPFAQANSDPHVSSNGSGLGLSIVKSLAESLGAVLRIESSVGVGTTVNVTFPINDRNAA